MALKGKKKSAAATDDAPLKLFYIFYSQERFDNWLKVLSEADFSGEDEDEMPEGFSLLNGFNQDICIEVLKIVKLYQNNRFTADEAKQKITEVEEIVMGSEVTGVLEEIVSSLQFSMLVLFAAVRKFIDGGFEEDIKGLIKKGRAIKDEDGQMDELLGIASEIGASVINGKTCCGRYIKDSDEPGMFDEWLIEVETINEAMTTLKNFDEEAGESS